MERRGFRWLRAQALPEWAFPRTCTTAEYAPALLACPPSAVPALPRRPDNSSPLTVAAYLGHVEIVNMLLEAGAKLMHKDEDGSALDNARRQGHEEVRAVRIAAQRRTAARRAM